MKKKQNIYPDFEKKVLDNIPPPQTLELLMPDMQPHIEYQKKLKEMWEHEYNYTIAWMRILNIIDENKEFESSKRSSYCKGFLGYKTILILACLLFSSCASTYRIQGHKVKVHDNSPRKYGFVLAVGFGLGEQFRKPRK